VFVRNFLVKMAFVVRSGRLAGPLRNYLRPIALGNRCISTSKKKDETAVVTEKIPSHKVTHDIDVAAASARKVLAIIFLYNSLNRNAE
jgi:hypothetical protein